MPGPLAIASVALPFLQKLGEGRDVRRYKQQLEQQQKTANLIGALSKGRVQYQPTAEYKPSAFTRLTGAASTGLGAYNTFQNLQGQQAAQKLAQETGEAQLAKLRTEAAIRQGAAEYMGRDRPKIGEWTPPSQAAPKIGEWAPSALPPPSVPPRVGAGPQLGGGLDMGLPPTGALDTGPPPTLGPPPRLISQLGQFKQMGMERAKQAEAEKIRQSERERKAYELKQYEAYTNRLKAAGAFKPEIVTTADQLKVGTPIVVSAANTGKSWSELVANPDIASYDPSVVRSLRAAYDNAVQEKLALDNTAISDFLYKDVKALANTNALIRKASDLPFGANLLITGFNQQDGIGDLQMITASVRLGDPGMGVRPIEAAQFETAGGVVEGWLVYGEKFVEGDRFRPEVRKRLLKAGLDQYTGQMKLLEATVNNLEEGAIPRALQIAGIPVHDFTNTAEIKEAAKQVPGFNAFFNNFKLPPLDSYPINAKTLEAYQKGELRIEMEGPPVPVEDRGIIHRTIDLILGDDS